MPPTPTLREAVPVWARIGLQSFGGPAGQIGVMHRILVEERGYVAEDRFLHALNFCMLLPGPEATQLAIYVGWWLHGVPGGLVAGGLFVLPGCLALLGLSAVYATFHQVPWIAAGLWGLKCAVLAVVVQALARIGGRVLTSRSAVAIAALSGFALVAGVPFPAVILAAGLWGFVRAPRGTPGVATAHPSLGTTLRTASIWLAIWLAPVLGTRLVVGPDHVFTRIAGFFARTAALTFGGAYGVLGYVAQQAVDRYGWMAPGEMLDGLGMAETTPGPLVLVTQHVGFLAAYRDPGGLPPLLAGAIGAALTSWVTFAPCFLWIFAGAPWIEALRGRRDLAGALAAITAAVVGVIAHLTGWLALRTLVDAPSIGLATLAALALIGLRRPLHEVLGGAVLLGLLARALSDPAGGA